MRSIKNILNFILNSWTILTVLLVIFIVHLWASLPTAEKIRGCIVTKMHKVHLCPGTKDYVPFNGISKHLRNSVLISEDGNFYNHNGFDFDEIRESFRKNIEKKTYVRGASTITQQLAKNMFLTSEKTIIRKVKEAAITYRLEQYLTKNEILERYFNVVQFGTDIYGIKAASEFYFNKTPAQLSVLESAFLTMLLPNPEKYAVSFEKHSLTKFARARLNQIVNRLYDFHKIDLSTYALAKINIDSFPWSGPLISDVVPSQIEKPDEDVNVPDDEEEYSGDTVEEMTSDYL